MDKFEKSAIIGFYLCGATMEEMCYASDHKKSEIEKVIEDYLEKLNKKLCLNEN